LEYGSGDPAFTTWDCGRQNATVVRDPTASPGQRGSLSQVTNPANGGTLVNLADERGTYVATPAPSPSLRNPQGSVRDGIDNAGDLYAPIYYQPNTGSRFHGCNGYGTANSTDLEDPFSGTNPTDGKRLTDLWMHYDAGVATHDSSLPPVISLVLGKDTPQSFGKNTPATWFSDVEYLPPPYLGGTIRSSDLKPAGALYWTWFAMVGQGAITANNLLFRTGGLTGTYGAEACGAERTGVHNNWDCDPTHWWNPDLGGTPDGRWINEHARPGWSYRDRDVDCYDGTLVTGVPAYASLQSLSDDPPCPRV
jgi:hypothetical protein